jgi:hypothetical protein
MYDMATYTLGIKTEFLYEITVRTGSYDERPYILTYLLTPWSRVLLEKLTGSGNFQNSNGLSEIWDLWMEEYFRFFVI